VPSLPHTFPSPPQARDLRTNEVVAVKKMAYGGKQADEVRGCPTLGGLPHT